MSIPAKLQMLAKASFSPKQHGHFGISHKFRGLSLCFGGKVKGCPWVANMFLTLTLTICTFYVPQRTS